VTNSVIDSAFAAARSAQGDHSARRLLSTQCECSISPSTGGGASDAFEDVQEPLLCGL
jgi:hypothetical protein